MGEVDCDQKIDDYFCLQDIIFKTIDEFIQEEYWKFLEINIKHKI